MTNRVVHFDIHVDDVERALAFYQTVFGWTIQKVEWMDYWLSKTGEGEPGIDGDLGKRTSRRTERFPVWAHLHGGCQGCETLRLQCPGCWRVRGPSAWPHPRRGLRGVCAPHRKELPRAHAA